MILGKWRKNTYFINLLPLQCQLSNFYFISFYCFFFAEFIFVCFICSLLFRLAEDSVSGKLYFIYILQLCLEFGNICRTDEILSCKLLYHRLYVYNRICPELEENFSVTHFVVQTDGYMQNIVKFTKANILRPIKDIKQLLSHVNFLSHIILLFMEGLKLS